MLNGQDWMDNAPAHSYPKATALALSMRVVKRALTLADIGDRQGGPQKKIDYFPCSFQPEGAQGSAESAKKISELDKAEGSDRQPHQQTTEGMADPKGRLGICCADGLPRHREHLGWAHPHLNKTQSG